MIDFQKLTESGTRWRLTLAPNRGVGAVFDGQSPIHVKDGTFRKSNSLFGASVLVAF